MDINVYEKQLEDFLKKTNTTVTIEFGGCTVNELWEKTLPNTDRKKNMRNFYHVTITNPNGSMFTKFWDSIHNTEISKMDVEEYTKKQYRMHYADLTIQERYKADRELQELKKVGSSPTAYTVFSCFTLYDVGSFSDFCSEFGYDDDSIHAYKIYEAVVKEYENLRKLFTEEELDELSNMEF